MRKTPIKKVNRKRRASEFSRAYGSKERVSWVQSLNCVVGGIGCYYCGWRTQNAHVENGGMRRKADACHIVPLCASHHAWLHSVGREAFEDACKIDLSRAAAETERLWQEHLQEGMK